MTKYTITNTQTGVREMPAEHKSKKDAIVAFFKEGGLSSGEDEYSIDEKQNDPCALFFTSPANIYRVGNKDLAKIHRLIEKTSQRVHILGGEYTLRSGYVLRWRGEELRPPVKVRDLLNKIRPSPDEHVYFSDYMRPEDKLNEMLEANSLAALVERNNLPSSVVVQPLSILEQVEFLSYFGVSAELVSGNVLCLMNLLGKKAFFVFSSPVLDITGVHPYFGKYAIRKDEYVRDPNNRFLKPVVGDDYLQLETSQGRVTFHFCEPTNIWLMSENGLSL